MQTLQYAVRRDDGAARARLNPDLRYLRVVVDARVVLLVLGNQDGDARNPIEVWYGGGKEVLRFQNGRLVGAVGLTTEWRDVVLADVPSWSALARAGGPVQWTRVRDVMPGYRYGVAEALSTRVMLAPRQNALQGVDAQALTWFEEKARSGNGLDDALPPARYAVDFRQGRETVMYGEQCLAPTLCFSWQRWPVAGQ